MLRKLTLPALGLVVVGSTLWQMRRTVAVAEHVPQRTELVAARIHAEARVVSAPGAEVVVGVERGGRLARLLVEEGRPVRAGDVIAELDADEDQAALAEAKARLAQAEAELRFAGLQHQRAGRLHAQNAGSADAIDRAAHERDVAAAQRDLARATVRRLGAGLAKTRITAPIDGVVVARHATAGEVVAPGAPLATIADLSRTCVVAEVDEYDIGRVNVGDTVRVSAEGYDEGWDARVEEIPEIVSRRGLRPQDPGRPSDTGVLLVRIAPVEPLPLKLGQRAAVQIVSRPAAAVSSSR